MPRGKQWDLLGEWKGSDVALAQVQRTAQHRATAGPTIASRALKNNGQVKEPPRGGCH